MTVHRPHPETPFDDEILALAKDLMMAMRWPGVEVKPEAIIYGGERTLRITFTHAHRLDYAIKALKALQDLAEEIAPSA